MKENEPLTHTQLRPQRKGAEWVKKANFKKLYTV